MQWMGRRQLRHWHMHEGWAKVVSVWQGGGPRGEPRRGAYPVWRTRWFNHILHPCNLARGLFLCGATTTGRRRGFEQGWAGLHSSRSTCGPFGWPSAIPALSSAAIPALSGAFQRCVACTSFERFPTISNAFQHFPALSSAFQRFPALPFQRFPALSSAAIPAPSGVLQQPHLALLQGRHAPLLVGPESPPVPRSLSPATRHNPAPLP